MLNTRKETNELLLAGQNQNWRFLWKDTDIDKRYARLVKKK